MAAAPDERGAGASGTPESDWMLPGRAVASRIARKVDCADRTEWGKFAAGISAFSSHQREELHLGGGGLPLLRFARGLEPRSKRRKHGTLDRLAMGFALHQRVAQRDQLRL